MVKYLKNCKVLPHVTISQQQVTTTLLLRYTLLLLNAYVHIYVYIFLCMFTQLQLMYTSISCHYLGSNPLVLWPLGSANDSRHQNDHKDLMSELFRACLKTNITIQLLETWLFNSNYNIEQSSARWWSGNLSFPTFHHSYFSSFWMASF